MDLSKLTPAVPIYPGDDVARSAFDVMMRRGWTAVPFAYRDGKIASWNVAHENGSVQGPEGDGEWADPFTALVEADRWFRENVEASSGQPPREEAKKPPKCPNCDGSGEVCSRCGEVLEECTCEKDGYDAGTCPVCMGIIG